MIRLLFPKFTRNPKWNVLILFILLASTKLCRSWCRKFLWISASRSTSVIGKVIFRRWLMDSTCNICNGSLSSSLMACTLSCRARTRFYSFRLAANCGMRKMFSLLKNALVSSTSMPDIVKACGFLLKGEHVQPERKEPVVLAEDLCRSSQWLLFSLKLEFLLNCVECFALFWKLQPK